MHGEEEKHPPALSPTDAGGTVSDSNKDDYLGPPMYGVRSYLHQFYQAGQKNPTIYEDDGGDEYFLEATNYDQPQYNKLWYHKPILWKALVWIGINFLVFGIIGIFVAYLVPRERVYIETPDQHYFIIQKTAEEYNNNLELIKLVALALFCSGALLTVVALLIPSIFWKDCMDARGRMRFHPRAFDIQEPIRVRIKPAPSTAVVLAAAKEGQRVVQVEGSPPEYTPTVATNASVQPQRKADEAFLTKGNLQAVVTNVN